MWPYWVMFLIPAWMALNEQPRRQLAAKRSPVAQQAIPQQWWVVFVVMTLFVGWRHQVGGDWGSYLRQFENAIYESQFAEWWQNDPGYRLLEWLALKLDGGIYLVNLIGGSLFSYGLIRFCLNLPRPWLALAVAVPYLVIILGMGYTRQGIALGCIMVGLVELGHAQVFRFVIWVVLGASFHKSGVLILPLAAMAASKKRLVTLLWIGVIGFIAYLTLLEDSVDHLTKDYVDAEMVSEGAKIRLLMNIMPGGLFLLKSKSFARTPSQRLLWFWMAVAAIALFLLYFVSSASTAIDRVALYVLPVQMLVFSQLPEVFGRLGNSSTIWVYTVLIYYALVEFVWLNFAVNSRDWIPYSFYLFVNFF